MPSAQLAAIGNVFSANSETTGQSSQSAYYHHSENSGNRWGEDGYQQSGTSSSSFRSDPDPSKIRSSIKTIPEGMKSNVRLAIARGVDTFNYLLKKKVEAQSPNATPAPDPKNSTW